MDLPEYDAIVLAGGEGARLGGVDKAALEVAGRPMLDHVLDAVRGAGTVVVVGPDTVDPRGHQRVQEDPPLGGPAAGVAAGLAALTTPADTVLVVACDQPLAGAAIDDLRAALAGRPGADGAVLVAADGHRQTLLAAYRSAALQAVVRRIEAERGLSGASMRALVGPMDLVEVVDTHGAAQDGDTWADIEALTARLGGHHG